MEKEIKKPVVKKKRKKSDLKLALALLSPSIILLAGLVVYPMISNVVLSFFDQPINPNLPSEFVGLEYYAEILKDPEFWNSLFVTIAYTILTVIGSTVVGLAVAMFFNREFRFRKLSRSLIILSYVAPSISLVYVWKYMFNQTYGIINYILVDVTGLLEQAPLWFDDPLLSFIVVVVFAIWKYFPYAFISFLAILQTVDKSLYEAADIDGATSWEKFKVVTLPAIKPVLLTVVTLRFIWMFYMFTDVYLLTNQVNTIGIYLYETAFAYNDLGKAAAISVILFAILFTTIMISRKKVDLDGGK